MPIPGDPENRWWVQALPESEICGQLRDCLVAFMASDRNQVQQLAGTGFFIAANNQLALGLTAKHVLSEGVLNIQRPHRSHATSALSMFLPPSATTPTAEPQRLKALWMGQHTATALNVAYAFYSEALDIAVCAFTVQEGETQFTPLSISIDTAVPSVGDVVHMVSQNGLSAENHDRDAVQSNAFGVTIRREVVVRVGVVTNVYPNGYRQYRWPCFTTSIPAEPGMSGGFVCIPGEGTTISACGVVCADNSTQEARSSFIECGESVIGCCWPALGLRVPESIPASIDTKTIHQMMQMGNIPQALGRFDQILVDDLGNGESTVYRAEA